MDYKEKYEMALEGIQEILGSGEDSIKMSRLQLRLQGIFPELKESEDERIRKAIHIYLDWLDGRKDYSPRGEYTIRDMIAWVEKQGEHANFRNKIQIGDKVTRNEDGVLVNLSQLNRVAKKQGEQKPVVIIPKFRVGDEIKTSNEESLTITKIDEKGYWSEDLFICCFDEECVWDLVEQNPAWSDEDEKVLDNILYILNQLKDTTPYKEDKTAENCIDWLKSIKERYTWKPSEEQMNALNYVVNLMASSERPTENDLYYNILKSLRQQLMKLKG